MNDTGYGKEIGRHCVKGFWLDQQIWALSSNVHFEHFIVQAADLEALIT